MSLNIAICGCGIGGLSSALFLARQGHAVTLYERFDTPRPIGSGFMLQPIGMAVLEQLGLADTMRQRGARIERLFGKSQPSGAVVLDVRYDALDAKYSGLAVQRAALFDALYQAVTAAAIPVKSAHTVTHHAGETLHFANADAAGPFDLIIDALGVQSPLSAQHPGRALAYGALWATLDWPDAPFDPNALEQRYVRASKMAGVLPIGSERPGGPAKTAFFWSLHRNALHQWQDNTLGAWKAQARALWPETEPLLDQINTHDDLTFATYRHRTLSQPYEGRLIHIGDSYHATSPQLGQGANMALLDAYALAEAVSTGRAPCAIGPAFHDLRHRHVMLFQLLSRLFTPVYQSDSRILPILRDRIVGPLSKVPPAPAMLGRIVTGLLGGPLDGMGLEG